MRVLLTGGAGQFGRTFRRLAAGRHAVTATSHRGEDGLAALAVEDAAAVSRAVVAARPEAVVHAAAVTDVDLCEADPALAQRVNADGCGNVAAAAFHAGARLVVLSTDYVFDGEKGRYREADPPAPLGAYGRSKLDGERQALAAHPGACVARTSVVFGAGGRNFVSWVAESLRQGRRIRAVADQWVSPTSAQDLSEQVLALLDAGATGVWHAAGADRLSRLEMAQRIAAHGGLDAGLIEPAARADMAWRAPRPRDSSLDVTKVSRISRPLPFHEALSRLGGAP